MFNLHARTREHGAPCGHTITRYTPSRCSRDGSGAPQGARSEELPRLCPVTSARVIDPSAWSPSSLDRASKRETTESNASPLGTTDPASSPRSAPSAKVSTFVPLCNIINATNRNRDASITRRSRPPRRARGPGNCSAHTTIPLFVLVVLVVLACALPPFFPPSLARSLARSLTHWGKNFVRRVRSSCLCVCVSREQHMEMCPMCMSVCVYVHTASSSSSSFTSFHHTA